jgi:sugar phosphate isomerase/epimerase
MTLQDRRSFIVTLGGSALALAGFARGAAALPASLPPSRRRLQRIGLQLYSVRRQATADLPETLVQLAKIGYQEIEFYGSFKQTSAEIRQILDHNGLKSPSVHIGLPATPAAFDKIFADAKTMGQEWIVVASPPFMPKTVDDWKRLAAQFNDAGARTKAAGFRFAFHNHTEGFKKLDDVVPWEMLVRETDPAHVSFELDINWAYVGGADPIDLIDRFPKRIKMVHVKDSSGPPSYTQTDVGAGTYPWAKIFEAATRAGVEHYFAESDDATDPMAFAKNSYNYLAKLEF